jgi:hypothetical protein
VSRNPSNEPGRLLILWRHPLVKSDRR